MVSSRYWKKPQVRYVSGKVQLPSALLLLSCLSCAETPNRDIRGVAYPNVLDVHGTPVNYRDIETFSFSDLGAWHTFGLPDTTRRDLWAGFTGPFLLTHYGAWLGQSFIRLVVSDDLSGHHIDWGMGSDYTSAYYPGRLVQAFGADGLDVQLDLIFVTNRTALVRARITNFGNEPRRLSIGWTGDVWLEQAVISADSGAVLVRFSDNPALVELRATGSWIDDIQNEQDDLSYLLPGPVVDLPVDGFAIAYATVSVYFDANERTAELEVLPAILGEPELHFDENASRWRGYLQAALKATDPQVTKPEYRSVLVKAVETLITNWRSPAGHLYHNGIFPSYAYRGFHGVWSWDSWKHARALVNFAPELAKDQLRVMFDYQDQYGMVADVIYTDSTENNWRDTKPPLSAWAVWAIYERTADMSFIEEVYPKLVQYHGWWYLYRDHDRNGLCEYGSTDGTRVAAGWESGMDNAVRFDDAAIRQNKPGAWSLDQESVDLNSYLYAEKLYLASMAEVLGQEDEAAFYRDAAAVLRERIQTMMFDEETGYFYDIGADDKQPRLVQGPEGWIPLWAGVASQEQAERVMQVMMDSTKFATRVPLPTLAADHEKFDPRDGYWRGSVWLDQAYFGVRGLERYGFVEEANILRQRLFESPVGLLQDGPIHENYHPLTGEPLNAPHFSWSAAHLLLLLEENTSSER